MLDDLLSIHNTALRCKSEGIPLSEKSIRRFVKDGTLVSVKTGKKVLIFYPNVQQLIQSGNNYLETPSHNNTGTIRKIQE